MRDHRSGRARRWRRAIARTTTARFHHIHHIDHHTGDNLRSSTNLPRSLR